MENTSLKSWQHCYVSWLCVDVECKSFRGRSHTYTAKTFWAKTFLLKRARMCAAHLYSKKQKHRTARSSKLQQNRACSKQKHWPLFEDKTFSCACAFNTRVFVSVICNKRVLSEFWVAKTVSVLAKTFLLPAKTFFLFDRTKCFWFQQKRFGCISVRPALTN